MMVRLGLVSLYRTLTVSASCCRSRCCSLGLRQGVEMVAIYNGLLVSVASCTIPSLTEDESTISLKAIARLETA